MTPDYLDCAAAFEDRECDVHTLPDDDREHVFSDTCWCEPECYYENPETSSKAWAHREVH